MGGGRRCVRDWKGSGVGRLYGGVSGLSGDVGQGMGMMRLAYTWCGGPDRVWVGVSMAYVACGVAVWRCDVW